jgi:16S rRNA (cytosine1402-N4)-methyltransferase
MSKTQPPQHEVPEELNRSLETSDQLHTPVLLDQVVELLAPRPGETYLDLTAGYGGHAKAVIAGIQDASLATLVDRDENAIAELAALKRAGAIVFHEDYATFAEQAVQEGAQYDMVLVDLGVSSPQLDRAERGFSLKQDGPLDMRMDERQEKTAADIVNRTRTSELVRIIERYGEESPKAAERIVKAIIAARPITTTAQLAAVVLSTHHGKYQKVHPATRTFQAIRIALNEELEQLERLLAVVPDLLAPKGRIAFISFHSLEDRLVINFRAEESRAGYEARLGLLTKKAIRGATSDVHNPRARSANLRAAVKK